MTTNGKIKILVVEDDETLQMVFQKALEAKGYAVDLTTDGDSALRLTGENHYMMIFMDINMPGLSGLDILAKMKQVDSNIIVIMMTAENTMDNAIQAMKRGAYDYLPKPIDIDEIYLLLEKIQKELQMRHKMSTYEQELKERFGVCDIIGKGRKMQDVFKMIGKTADSNLTVLITGESGTGKELVARALHYSSSRVVYPFVPVNCAAIPKDLLESELFGHEKGSFTGALELKKGKFELAEKGTLFLDEIGDMDMNIQAKILRVLQEKEYQRVGGKDILKSDVRIIAATNRDIEKSIKEKSFREDLYHRLHVMAINLPPLRERTEDIPSLVEYFINKFSREVGSGVHRISSEALDLLLKAEWPGNIRQLENTIKRGMVLSPHDTIFPEHLPDSMSKVNRFISENVDNENRLLSDQELDTLLSDKKNKGFLFHKVITEVEKKLIGFLLSRHGWNQVKVAEWLGINRNTLKRKMDALSIKKL